MTLVKKTITSIVLFLEIIAIPVGVYAQTVNESSELFSPGDIIPQDNTVGPVGIVNELYEAHNDLTNIMELQASGDYSTPDYPFVMTFVDEEKGDLVVMMHVMAAIVGIDYDEEEIQIAIGHDIPVEIIYGEFQLEVSDSRIESWKQYYIDHCSPVQAGYQTICDLYGGYLIENGIDPTSLVTTPTTPEPEPTLSTTSPCDDDADSLACYYYTRYLDRCIPTHTTSRCDTYATQITNAGYTVPTTSSEPEPEPETLEPNPTNVVAILSGNTITVTWTAPDYDIEKYKIYTYENDRYGSRDYVTTESFTLNDVNEGSEYKFKVRAYYDEYISGVGSRSDYVYSNTIVVPITTPEPEPEPMIPEVPTLIPEVPRISATQEIYGGMPILSYGTFLIDGTDPYADGTLGIIVEKDNSHYAITASHVVSWNQFSSINLDNGDTQISHPLIGSRIIASTHVEQPNTITSADAASILVTGIGIESNPNQIKASDIILNVTEFGGLDELSYPLVEKSGRHGISSGTVIYQNVTVALSDDNLSFVLTNQASVVGMSSHSGDSGSPIYVKNNGTAQLIGLLVGVTCELTTEHNVFVNVTYVDDYGNQICNEFTGNKLSILSTWENISRELGLQ